MIQHVEEHVATSTKVRIDTSKERGRRKGRREKRRREREKHTRPATSGHVTCKIAIPVGAAA